MGRLFLLPSPGPRVFGIRLQVPATCNLSPATCHRMPATCQPGASHQPATGPPATGPPATSSQLPKVLHPYGVVVVVAHPPLGLYIRIF